MPEGFEPAEDMSKHRGEHRRLEAEKRLQERIDAIVKAAEEQGTVCGADLGTMDLTKEQRLWKRTRARRL